MNPSDPLSYAAVATSIVEKMRARVPCDEHCCRGVSEAPVVEQKLQERAAILLLK